MKLTSLDWSILLAFFVVYLGIGLYLSRRSGRSFTSFFLGGRTMPWWLLGISMVATTFSTDTPNLVTDIVRSDGVYGNWVWWAFLLTGMVTVFFYSRLWRRSEVLTDIEFYELRYSGRMAAFLRGFRAVYLGFFFNLIIMASVTLAAIKIGGVMLGLTPIQTISIAAIITVAYTISGGFTGVLITDLVQFTAAMIGSVAAACYVVNLPEVGGLKAMLAHPDVFPKLAFFPDFNTVDINTLIVIFIIPLSVQWWAAYYPGAEPGGGGYLVQRMLSAKDEKHALGATLLFNCLHYALRPWPWILVALASLIVFPDLASLAERFPHLPEQVIRNDLAYSAMLTYLPEGLTGLVVASLIAAYMSTMSTQMNWGASILVNDVYHRFFRKDSSETELVWAGRAMTLALVVVACSFALFLENALQLFNIMLQIGAGTGLLLMLRWYWWRINAAAELTAMIVSFVVAVLIQILIPNQLQSWQEIILGVGLTTLSWIVVTVFSNPTSEETLIEFYAKVHPSGPGWNRIRIKAEKRGLLKDVPNTTDDLHGMALCSVCGAMAIYGTLFATGYLIYGHGVTGLLLLCVAGPSAWVVMKRAPKLNFKSNT